MCKNNICTSWDKYLQKIQIDFKTSVFSISYQIAISNTILPTALRLFRNSNPSSRDWLLKGSTFARIGLIKPSSARLRRMLSVKVRNGEYLFVHLDKYCRSALFLSISIKCWFFLCPMVNVLRKYNRWKDLHVFCKFKSLPISRLGYLNHILGLPFIATYWPAGFSNSILWLNCQIQL